MKGDYTTVKLLLRDSKDNAANKNIISFFRNNYKEILMYGFYTRMIIVDESNIEDFKELGVDKMPSLLINNKVIASGVHDIKIKISELCSDEPSECEVEESKEHFEDSVLDILDNTDVTLEDKVDMDDGRIQQKMKEYYKKQKDPQEVIIAKTIKEPVKHKMKNTVKTQDDEIAAALHS